MSDHDDPSVPKTPSRRVFLMGSAALLGAAACGNGDAFNGNGAPDSGATTSGDSGAPRATTFSIGACTRIKVSATKFYFIMRDSMGFYAMSAKCTHQLTTMPCPDSSGLIDCPLHHTKFDLNGIATSDPDNGDARPGPLDHFQVDFPADGTVTANVNIVVDRTMRFNPTTA